MKVDNWVCVLTQQLLRYAEVAEFSPALAMDKDVVRFDVAVHLLLVDVEVVDSVQNLNWWSTRLKFYDLPKTSLEKSQILALVEHSQQEPVGSKLQLWSPCCRSP